MDIYVAAGFINIVAHVFASMIITLFPSIAKDERIYKIYEMWGDITVMTTLLIPFYVIYALEGV